MLMAMLYLHLDTLIIFDVFVNLQMNQGSRSGVPSRLKI